MNKLEKKIVFLLLFVVTLVNAQIGVGTKVPHPDAMLEVASTNKGLLLPRVALSATTSSAPLNNHVAGMTVYNTATVADVTAGYYYNDGAKWVKLSNGTVGPQGPAGANGATAYQIAVTNGYSGTETQWLASLQGLVGATGPQGPIGLTGPAGAVGAAGPQGIQGLTGPAGANGTNGLDGKSVLNGTTNPVAGTGANGDFYINTTSNTIFGPKAAGAWPASGTSLVGPAGSGGSITGTAPIAVTSGVVSLNDLGIDSAKLADASVTSAKIADGTITAVDLNQMAATSGQVLKWSGTAWAPAADNDNTNAITDLQNQMTTSNDAQNTQINQLISENNTQNTQISAINTLNTIQSTQITQINQNISSLQNNVNAPTVTNNISGNSLTTTVNGTTSTAVTLPISDGSETKVNAGTNVTITGAGTSVSPYVVNSAGAVDATTTANGIVRLAGDLTGTAAIPTITNSAVINKVLTGYTSTAGTVAATDNIVTAIGKLNGNDALKAPIASPTFTGTPTLPTGTIGVTQTAGNNTTALATTAFVTTAVSAAATPDSDATTKGKIQLAGDLTGTAAIPTITNSAVINKVLTGYTSTAGTVAATDNIVTAIGKLNGNDALKAPVASPTFTGTPTLPTGTIGVTQTAGNNTTALATTAFVTTAVSAASTPDSDATIKGKIQLAGDLTGTADLPTIANNAVTSAKIADGTIAAADLNQMAATSGQVLKWSGTAWEPAADAGITTTTVSNSIDSGALTTTVNGITATSVTLPVADGSETKVNAGTNVTITGSGTVSSPYVINSPIETATQTPSTAITASGTQVAVLSTNVQGAIADLATAVKTAGNTNLYSANGTLSGNRSVTLNTNILSILGSSAGSGDVPDQTMMRYLRNGVSGQRYAPAFDINMGGFDAGNNSASTRVSFKLANGYISGGNTDTTVMTLLSNGNVSINNLSGTGTRMVVADATGVLSTQASTVNNVISVSTPTYTALAADGTLLVNVPSGGTTLTLPAASTNNGKILIIKKIDDDADILTLSTAVKVTSTDSFTTLNYAATLNILSDGTNWWLIN